MNLGRGFSVPQEKVSSSATQNGAVWIPATPEKSRTRMQQNQIGAENWEQLLGIYSEVLQDETTSRGGLPPNHHHPNGPNRVEPTIQGVAPATAYKTVPQNFNLNNPGLSGLNHHGVYSYAEDVAVVEKLWRSDRNSGGIGPYRQNVVEDVVVTPQKVNSLAELLGMQSCPAPIGSHFQSERNWMAYNNQESTMLLQSRVLCGGQDSAGGCLQQIPNSRVSVPYRPSYNLNLPPRLEAGESSTVARIMQLAPLTPDQQKQSMNNQIIDVPQFIDETPSQKNDKQDNVVLAQQPEIVATEHNDSLHNNTSGMSPAAIITTPQEKQISDGQNGGEIDLNKTPPQKTPKRRKHRPKVVIEGKPKRTPKPKATENNTPNGTPATKRKYVRRKGIETSTNQSPDAANKLEVSNVGSEAKSCKRALNFDLENVVEKKSKGSENDCQPTKSEGRKVSFDLNLASDKAEWCNESQGPSTSAVQELHRVVCGKEKQTENFIHSVNKFPSQESLTVVASAPPPTSKDHTLNIIARILNMRNANINQSSGNGKSGQLHHHHPGRDRAQLVIQANNSDQNLDGKKQQKLQIGPQHLEELGGVNQKQGSSREYSHVENRTKLQMLSQIWSLGPSETGEYSRENIRSWQNAPESSRSKKADINITGLPFCSETAKDCPGPIGSTWNKISDAQRSGLLLNGGLPYFGSERKSTSINPATQTNKVKVTWQQYISSIGSGHRLHEQVNRHEEQVAPVSHLFDKGQSTGSRSAVSNWHMVPASRTDTKSTQGNEIIKSPANLPVKKQAARGQKSSKKLSSMDKMVQQETRKVTGSQEYERSIVSVDDIIDRFKYMRLNNNGKEVIWEDRNALVPYKGDGAVVPYEAFDPIKKRRPRPKVDLDPESNRLWNLLMGKEGDESAETMDNDKQKWWEEERKVFRGRVDSFIARMHLVQGDRRFSKWKGSVVDSVIGVFLTQNVSDHLSSSAFMSLAAKFPIKSTNIRNTCSGNTGNISRVLIRFPDGTSFDQGMIKEPVYDHSLRTGECKISSQSYSESVIFQASDDIRSSSGSNSEAEEQVTGSSFINNLGHLNSLNNAAKRNTVLQQYQVQEMGSSFPGKRPSMQFENLVYGQNPGPVNGRNAYSHPFSNNVLRYQRPDPPSTNSWQKLLMGLDVSETDDVAFMQKESRPSFASTEIEINNATCIEHAFMESAQSAESSLTGQQTGRTRYQSSTVNHEILNKHLEQQTVSPAWSQNRNHQHISNFGLGMQDVSHQESSCLTDSTRSAEAFSKQSNDNRERLTPEPTEMKKAHPSGVPSSKIGTTSNARKRKAEKEKAEPFNWDTLRTQLKSKAGIRGRSRETMDSLDYEALRNADVREISDAIKERGMNNMLAERIKDFLDRMVRDHGAMDLEWLRDVQPDKAKDYLLSIRGLGLKSVECVRLLTLHHLAFPVDTNVGRIAVRLGWVPLQPLPESLQLHLLELYPVLESIQKYLWPRLCMLDQETLYELHYQMITFGKVFCTKREPNCNACPMRAECRHFASAFASARLALPGPEERRIVSSAAPASSVKGFGMDVKSIALPPPENNLGLGPMRNCAPIIEEPTTPESPAEVSERDIEDAFYEDPDEIPVITLNIEEFTINLQNIMQDKLEMQEGDMSKALVALNPGLASIPTPKLKHISRLRTEHQVYELPDSHPLLKGMDRREPDDPSPYLLAIWTPGETADSIQPPESNCSTLEGGMCNKDTCFSCNSTREAHAQTVRGTILIPCRTAMRGSFPLNGTYFQVNEVFADHETSMNPIDVPRSLIWNLPRRTVFFGTSVSTIFKGLTTEGIQYCFWRGFVCVRGFDQKSRAPRPLRARLHLPASKMAKKNE